MELVWLCLHALFRRYCVSISEEHWLCSTSTTVSVLSCHSCPQYEND